jgi:molybdopterin-binding protein
MNSLKGRVETVLSSGNLNLVKVRVNGELLSSIIIGQGKNESYLEPGSEAEIIFNESEVSLGKIESGTISLSNQLPCTVQKIQHGKILSRVRLSFRGNEISSLITSASVSRLQLREGDAVTAFIKTTEVFLKETEN